MSAETLNQKTLALAAGALLSLASSYIPGLGERYAAWALFVNVLQKGEDKKDRDLHPPQKSHSLI
jgi:hypothetical protein